MLLDISMGDFLTLHARYGTARCIDTPQGSDNAVNDAMELYRVPIPLGNIGASKLFD